MTSIAIVNCLMSAMHFEEMHNDFSATFITMHLLVYGVRAWLSYYEICNFNCQTAYFQQQKHFEYHSNFTTIPTKSSYGLHISVIYISKVFIAQRISINFIYAPQFGKNKKVEYNSCVRRFEKLIRTLYDEECLTFNKSHKSPALRNCGFRLLWLFWLRSSDSIFPQHLFCVAHLFYLFIIIYSFPFRYAALRVFHSYFRRVVPLQQHQQQQYCYNEFKQQQ